MFAARGMNAFASMFIDIEKITATFKGDGGVEAKLRAGAKVADGCGHGASVVVMAQAYPDSRIWGFDFHALSIDTARSRAEDGGVADRTTFEVANSKGYEDSFGLIRFFDCLHDMGDPIGIVRYARQHPNRGEPCC